MTNDKISVITVCYNAADTIDETIKSVLGQDFDNYEYIIVDGASQDSTIEIVTRYESAFAEKNVSFKVLSEKDNGIYDAMNKAIDLAVGDWLIFMNADDRFYNSEVLNKVFETDLREYSAVYGDYVQFDGRAEYPMKSEPIETMPKKMPFMHQSVFVRHSLHKKYKFDLLYKLCADYDFFFKLYALGYKFKQIDVFVCNYSVLGISGSALLDAQKEVIQIKKKNSKQFPITITDILKWKIDACKMQIKMLLPEEVRIIIRQIKH